MIALRLLTTLILLLLVAAGCGGQRTTSFTFGEYNFQFIEKVAIIPFENLSASKGAGARATQIFIPEVLAAEVFDVVEPGEVSHVLGKHGITRTAQLTTEQIIKIGGFLKVQALILGSVTEASNVRSGGSSVKKVSMVVRMVETERGLTVWSATATAGSRGFWGSLFGTSGKSLSEVTRDCVRKALNTLVK